MTFFCWWQGNQTKMKDSWGTATRYQGLTTNATDTLKSPNGKYIAFQSFPLSFQDINYKIPEQWDSWSRYKVHAKRGERLKAYSRRNRIAITSLVLWFLTDKEYLQPKSSHSYLHKEWDTDTRQKEKKTQTLCFRISLKRKIIYHFRSYLLQDSRQNWRKPELTNSSATPIWGIFYCCTSLGQY